jgi:Lon protease-like protein
MATNTIFGYSIEEQEGKLVITVSGAFATEALRVLKEDFESGNTPSVSSLLSHIVPFGRLLSGRVALRQAEATGAEDETSAEAESLAQEVDQTLDTFRRQMVEFRTVLDELRVHAPHAPEAPAAPAAPAPSPAAPRSKSRD